MNDSSTPEPQRRSVPVRLWDWLGAPSSPPPETRRRQSHLLSSLLLALWTLSILSIGLLFLAQPTEGFFLNPALPGALAAILLLSLAYGLNRAGHYQLAATLTVAITALGAWAAILASRGDVVLEGVLTTYTLISLLLASLLLSARFTIIVGGLHLVVYLLLQEFLRFMPATTVVNAIVAAGFLAALLVVAALIRERDEARIEQQTRQLSESETRYRSVAETMAEGLVVEDTEGRFTFVNPRIQTILGYAPEELVGQHWSRIVSAEDREHVARESAQRPAGITGVYETKLLAKDGREVPVLVSAAPLERDGQFAGTVVTFADISENKRTEAAEREQRALAEALRDSTAALSGTLNLDEVLDRVIANAGRVVPHDAADIMLIESGVSRVVRCRGYAERGLEDWLLAQRFSVADFPNQRRMIGTTQPIAIPDTRADAGWRLIPESHWIRSIASAPICSRGQVIGFLNLVSATPGFFTPDHAERLLSFANQAALAIENARLYASAQQNIAESTALYRASAQLLSPADDVTILADEIVRAVTREFALADCGVLLVDEAQTELERVARAGSFAVTATAVLPLDGPGLTVLAARSGQTVYAPDVAADPRYVPNNSGTRSELAIPLRAGGRVVGVLDLQSAELDAFDERARRIVTAFAEHAGFALDNLQLREKLREQSIRDPLTGLFNRRYLEETLEREVLRAGRREMPLGVIMLDIDHFKNFNDTFGHDAGDALLRELGAFLRAHVRQEDIACRYGGEEFALILPDASLEITRQRAAHLRDEVKQLRVQHLGGVLGVITLSLGVAVFREHGTTGVAVIRAADAALYRAKHEGRDRVVVAE